MKLNFKPGTPWKINGVEVCICEISQGRVTLDFKWPEGADVTINARAKEIYIASPKPDATL